MEESGCVKKGKKKHISSHRGWLYLCCLLLGKGGGVPGWWCWWFSFNLSLLPLFLSLSLSLSSEKERMNERKKRWGRPKGFLKMEMGNKGGEKKLVKERKRKGFLRLCCVRAWRACDWIEIA